MEFLLCFALGPNLGKQRNLGTHLGLGVHPLPLPYLSSFPTPMSSTFCFIPGALMSASITPKNPKIWNARDELFYLTSLSPSSPPNGPCSQPTLALARHNLFPNIDRWEMSRVCLMKLAHGLPPRSGCKENGLEIAQPLPWLTAPSPSFLYNELHGELSCHESFWIPALSSSRTSLEVISARQVEEKREKLNPIRIIMMYY